MANKNLIKHKNNILVHAEYPLLVEILQSHQESKNGMLMWNCDF
jgi:hypothetical protein